MANVVVAHRHRMILEALASFLAVQPAITVVAQADQGGDAVDRVGEWQPHVAVVDVGLPGLPTKAVVSGVRAVAPGTHIIVLMPQETPVLRALLVRAGATSCVAATRPFAELVQAIAEVIHTRPPDIGFESTAPELTARELEVIRLVSLGYSNADIAGALFIAPGTVKRHLSQIYPKLNVTSRTAAARAASLLGLLG